MAHERSDYMKTLITGGCVCGAVRFECSAAPIMMLKCHCRDCQRVTGGPYAPAVIFPFSAFRVIEGKIEHYSTQSESGGQNLRGFCPTCGSRLTGAESPEKGIIGVLASSLDDPSIFKPTLEIYTSDAQSWDIMDSTTTKCVRGIAR